MLLGGLSSPALAHLCYGVPNREQAILWASIKSKDQSILTKRANRNVGFSDAPKGKRFMTQAVLPTTLNPQLESQRLEGQRIEREARRIFILDSIESIVNEVLAFHRAEVTHAD